MPQTTTNSEPKRKARAWGNANNLKHGMRASTRLVVGKTPWRWINQNIYIVRTAIYAAAEQAGPVTFWRECRIQTALRCEKAALVLERWLRLNWDKMTDSDRLAFTQAVAKQSADRDRALKDLGLDKEPSVIDALYAPRLREDQDPPQDPSGIESPLAGEHEAHDGQGCPAGPESDSCDHQC